MSIKNRKSLSPTLWPQTSNYNVLIFVFIVIGTIGRCLPWQCPMSYSCASAFGRSRIGSRKLHWGSICQGVTRLQEILYELFYKIPKMVSHFRISWRWCQLTTVSKLKREREFAFVVAGVASREICPESRSFNCKRSSQGGLYCDTNETLTITDLSLDSCTERALGNHSDVSKF